MAWGPGHQKTDRHDQEGRFYRGIRAGPAWGSMGSVGSPCSPRALSVPPPVATASSLRSSPASWVQASAAQGLGLRTEAQDLPASLGPIAPPRPLPAEAYLF